MAPVTMDQLTAQVNKLAAELDRRSRRYALLESYYEGESPMPMAIVDSKVTKAYRRLMPVADAPWGSLVVDSVLDRLEVGGIRDKDSNSAADAVWDIWQRNHMDSESQLANCSGLISGRAFGLVWPDKNDEPQISLDSSSQMVVQYEEGSRHDRVAALRRWQDADTDQTMVTLYRPEGIYKFQQTEDNNAPSSGSNGWEKREVPDEAWPVENPFDVVPVAEITFNPRLKPGIFGYARGEYEHCRGVIDRINLLTFLGLVVAFWMGFPIRAVIGDRILRDDDGNVIPPFEATADSIVQLENPQATLQTYQAADRDNLAIFPELSQLAAITKTPRHYFPLAQAMANLSADAIRADEGALNAKVVKHKGSAGEGYEELLRLCGLMSGNELSPNAELVWLDHESRSLAEIADAATKLAPILPWQVLAEKILNATQDEIARWQVLKTTDAMGQLLAAAAKSSAAGALNASGDVTPEPPPAEAAIPETASSGLPETKADSGG